MAGNRIVALRRETITSSTTYECYFRVGTEVRSRILRCYNRVTASKLSVESISRLSSGRPDMWNPCLSGENLFQEDHLVRIIQ